MLNMKWCVATLLAAAAGPVMAAPVSFVGSQGNLQAQATFSTSGSDLVIRLTNTATYDAMVPSDLLTGVYFSVAAAPALSKTGGSARVSFGSVTMGGVQFTTPTNYAGWDGQDVGPEFAFRAVNGGGPGNGQYGLSSSGLGLFGPNDRFDTVRDLHPPEDPNGPNFGITTAGDNLATSNGGVSGVPIIKNEVVFALTGLPSGFVLGLGSITDVWFQYGTDLREPSMPGTPENVVPLPSAGLAASAGLLCILAVHRRRLIGAR